MDYITQILATTMWRHDQVLAALRELGTATTDQVMAMVVPTCTHATTHPCSHTLRVYTVLTKLASTGLLDYADDGVVSIADITWQLRPEFTSAPWLHNCEAIWALPAREPTC